MSKVYPKVYPKTYSKVYRKTLGKDNLSDVLALNPQVMFDTSVLSSMYQDSAKTTPVTSTGQPVGARVDLMGNAPDLLAPTNNARATYTTDGATSYLAYDGVDDQYISASKSAFNFLHDGTGGEFIGLYQFGYVANTDDRYDIFDNGAIASANIGFNVAFDDRSSQSRNNALLIRVARGVSGQYTASITAQATLTSNQAIVIGASYDASDTPELNAWVEGVNVDNIVQDYSPSISDSTNNAYFASTSVSGNPLLGRGAVEIFFDRKLSTSERDIVNSYLNARKWS